METGSKNKYIEVSCLLPALIKQDAFDIGLAPPAPELAQEHVDVIKSHLARNTVVCRRPLSVFAYTPETLLTTWLLTRKLKRMRTNIREVVDLVVRLNFDADAVRVVEQGMSDGTLRLPSSTTTLQTTMRINLLDISFQRDAHTHYDLTPAATPPPHEVSAFSLGRSCC